MSLESEIKNLTGAMTRLAEGVEKLLSISQPSAAPPVGARDTLVVDFPNDKPLEGGAINSPAVVTKQEIAAKAEPLVQTATAEAAPTFDDAKRAFLAIAQKYGAVEGTAKSREVLQRYGIPNLKALPVEQYPDFIELCNTVVAGGEV